MIWSSTVPLREEHLLTEEAADQLVEMVVGKPVTFTEPDEIIGACTDAERIEGSTQVKVTIRLQENDEAASQAFDMLRQCKVGVGLHMVLDDASRKVDGSQVKVNALRDVPNLMVVPLDSPSTYTDTSGGKTHEIKPAKPDPANG